MQQGGDGVGAVQELAACPLTVSYVLGTGDGMP